MLWCYTVPCSAVLKDSCSQVLNLGGALTSLPSGDDCHLALICPRNHCKAQKMLCKLSVHLIWASSRVPAVLCWRKKNPLARRGQQLSVRSCCVRPAWDPGGLSSAASLLCLPAAFGKAAVPRVQPLQGLLVGSLASSWVFFFSFLLLKWIESILVTAAAGNLVFKEQLTS